MPEARRLVFWLAILAFVLSVAAAIISENLIVALSGLVVLIVFALLPQPGTKGRTE